MAYIPDCASPTTQQQIREGLLPSNICDYPPEILAQICERQPSLCFPSDVAVQPKWWEPIVGTVQAVGEKILRTTEAVGTGAVGTIDLAASLAKVAPLLIIGGGAIWLMSQRK